MKAVLYVILALVLFAIIGYLTLLGTAAGTLEVYVRPLPIPVSLVALLLLAGIFILAWRSRRKGGPPDAL